MAFFFSINDYSVRFQFFLLNLASQPQSNFPKKWHSFCIIYDTRVFENFFFSFSQLFCTYKFYNTKYIQRDMREVESCCVANNQDRLAHCFYHMKKRRGDLAFIIVECLEQREQEEEDEKWWRVSLCMFNVENEIKLQIVHGQQLEKMEFKSKSKQRAEIGGMSVLWRFYGLKCMYSMWKGRKSNSKLLFGNFLGCLWSWNGEKYEI